MIIESITLTVDEMKAAVRGYLKTRGIDVAVKSVDTQGYPVKGYSVECSPTETVEPSPLTSGQMVQQAISNIPAPLNILAP